MANRVVIRIALQEDLPLLQNLLAEWIGWSGQEESIQRAINEKQILVAKARSKAAGFIHYAIHEDPVDGGPNALVTALYVSPRYRNMGIGSTLLEEVIQRAISFGAIEVEVSTSSQGARRFYEKRGFRQYWIDRRGRKRFRVFLEMNLRNRGKTREGESVS